MGRRRLCPFLIGFAVTVILVAIVLMVVFLVRGSKHGQDEEYDDAQFRVDSFTLSNLILGRNDSFAAEVRLTAQNPNKDTALSYDRVAAAVFYKSWSLARTDLPPFSLDDNSQAPLTASFGALAAGNFFEGDVATFDLRMNLTSEENEKNKEKKRKRKKKKKTKTTKPPRGGRGRSKSSNNTLDVLNVFCGGLVVAKPIDGRPGALTGGPRQCQVVDD